MCYKPPNHNFGTTDLNYYAIDFTVFSSWIRKTHGLIDFLLQAILQGTYFLGTKDLSYIEKNLYLSILFGHSKDIFGIDI